MTRPACGSSCACGQDTAHDSSDSAAARVAHVLNGIDRRTFLAQGTTAAVALALAACGMGGGPTAPGGTLSSQVVVTLSNYPALANIDGVAYVSANGNPLAIVRVSSSSFVALSRICPHAGNTIQAVSGGFYCPGHGAEFSFTGQWVGGQPTNSMTSYPTVYNATAGTVTIG